MGAVVIVGVATSLTWPIARIVAQTPPAGVSASRLRDLTTVDQLREAFDADTDKVRILLLLSPT
jgi:hypothetical protein